MSAPYYRLSLAVAASLSLLLGGCTATRTTQADATVAQLPQPQQQASVDTEGTMDTDSNIWTFLGIAKKPRPDLGPQTGTGVSPVIWQAALDTLQFVDMESLDPQIGLAVTKWYVPKGKPGERLRFTVFVKSRALRSDSVAVTVERQTREPGGQWQNASIDRDVVEKLETEILQRARQIHIARIREEEK
jgi:hypothetical protein